MTDTIDDLPRDDTGRITSDYEPTTVEIEVARQAICREFGNNGTDGYYIRILKAINAASHASAALAHPGQVREIAIKPLDWEEIGSGFYRAKAPLFGNIRVEKYGKRFTVCYSLPGYSDTFTPGDFATADAAKSAAQEDLERRVRSALALPLPVQEPVASVGNYRYEIQYGPEGEDNFAWVYRDKEMIATMRTHHAKSVCEALNFEMKLQLEKRAAAFEVLDPEDGLYLTRSEQAAINSGFEYNGLYRRAALSPSPSIPEEKWRDIETAPKDGTRILAANGKGGDIQITWFGKTSHVPLYGWCEGEDAEDIDLWHPTHWMPLPSSPTEGQTVKEGSTDE